MTTPLNHIVLGTYLSDCENKRLKILLPITPWLIVISILLLVIVILRITSLYYLFCILLMLSAFCQKLNSCR